MRVKPAVLHVKFTHNHCYVADERTKKLSHRHNKTAAKEEGENELELRPPSNKYRLRDSKGQKAVGVIDSEQDLDDFIERTHSESQPVYASLFCNVPLARLVFHMYDRYGLLVRLGKVVNGEVKEFSFASKGHYFVVTNTISPNSVKESSLPMDSLEMYQNYVQVNNNVVKAIINPYHLSWNTPEHNAIEDQYPVRVMTACLADVKSKGPYDAIDWNRAYTSCLMETDGLPVFNQHDAWLPYDGHEIDPYTQYIVRHEARDDAELLAYPDLHSRCYGYRLKLIDDIQPTVLMFRRPARVAKVDARELVKTVERSGLPAEYCKKIINVVIGQCNKKNNVSYHSKEFTLYGEAFYFATQLGARVRPVSWGSRQLYIVTKNLNSGSCPRSSPSETSSTTS